LDTKTGRRGADSRRFYLWRGRAGTRRVQDRQPAASGAAAWTHVPHAAAALAAVAAAWLVAVPGRRAERPPQPASQRPSAAASPHAPAARGAVRARTRAENRVKGRKKFVFAPK
jgi:hypothetical protein